MKQKSLLLKANADIITIGLRQEGEGIDKYGLEECKKDLLSTTISQNIEKNCGFHKILESKEEPIKESSVAFDNSGLEILNASSSGDLREASDDEVLATSKEADVLAAIIECNAQFRKSIRNDHFHF